ncbi:phage protease [Marinobacterium litorale]|uniref:phage protease n=1 Tax=Marinobacterium litorale TaxID=404770 RepID=UPI0003FEF559|nr:phage protease [Marinobacterium litorale]
MSISNHTALAVLASRIGNHPVAILALDLSADSDGWQQLLPAGHFKAIDGRPSDVPGGHWFLDEGIARRLIERAQAAANDLVIDYEHQTLYSEQNGQPAPAAGWFKDAEWRESGLWIRPSWTDRARDFIQSGEYRYLSAVFPYDKRTGEPLSLHSAALVNRPGIDGMQAVAALNAQLPITEQETVMNEHMRKLLAKLGIKIAEGAELTEEQATAALSALDGLTSKSERAGELETELATLKAKQPAQGVDLSKYVPVDTYNALVTAHAALKAGAETESAERLIADARKDGKVLAAEEDYLNQFAEQQGVAALKALIDARPAVAALKGKQTDEQDTQKDQGKGKDADLTSEDLAVLKATGQSREEFIKSKQELN